MRSCYFCNKCLKGYNNFNEHKCNLVCKACKKKDCHENNQNYKCLKCKVVCNSAGCLQYHEESGKDLVINKQFNKKISVEQNSFIRDKSNWTIRTEIINKLYGMVYDKRILLEDFSTIPYGY